MSMDTEIDHTSIKLVYLQVADAIVALIEAGRYPIKLPSERALAEEFGVSYATVRRAAATLRERGLIVSVHGRGTFVAPDHRPARHSQRSDACPWTYRMPELDPTRPERLYEKGRQWPSAPSQASR